MSLRARLLAALSLPFVLTFGYGCSSGASVQTTAGLDVLIAGKSSGGMDARFGGVLDVVGEDCVGVVVGDRSVAIAWPDRTDVSSDDGDLTLEVDGKRFGLGDTISGTGGELQQDSVLLPELPEGCAGLDIFAFQSVTAG